ncbi:cytochrome-c peroxidase [Echinicola strongylocentroti]|uniref:Methylamine utilization protein MauG n=1 Tax=Echinicola strongylocentroti TaxID=1795355 RepID=A0A2Z4IF60_9BACT|nr:cytochrome c peroxidase [Echinicola strongylocentroti]AWW29317.1 cytochrome-c peroxidase [Echinicola strongylocentroti]
MRYSIRLLAGTFILCGLLWACGNGEESEPSSQNPSLSLQHPEYFPNDVPMPADNPLTEKGVELGRMLFYDKQLSVDRTISCASCHQQEKAFTDGKKISTGVNDTPGDKNAMSLANLHWTSRFFWDGRAATLEEQAVQPIEDHREMNLPLDEAVARLQADKQYPERFEVAFGTDQITEELIGKAIAQFMRTLVSGDSKFDQWIKGEVKFSEQEQLGMELFFTHPEPSLQIRGGNCGDCHITFLTSGDRNNLLGFHNNGLDNDQNLEEGLAAVTGNPRDKGKFKAPTLRNIALTAPYMHDGRFETLEEVLEHYDQHVQINRTLDILVLEASNEIILPGEDIKLHLTDGEKEAILSFLQTLTDEKFITNPKFSDPFN